MRILYRYVYYIVSLPMDRKPRSADRPAGSPQDVLIKKNKKQNKNKTKKKTNSRTVQALVVNSTGSDMTLRR